MMPTTNERQADRKILRALTEVHGERKETLNDIRTKINAIAKEFGVKVRPIYNDYIDAGIAFRDDQLDEAITIYERILDILGSADNSILYSYTCVHMGTIYAMKGQFYMSQNYFTSAERKLRYIDKALTLLLNVNISGTYIQLKDYQSAINHARLAVDVGKNQTNFSTLSLAYSNLALALAKIGRLDEAKIEIETSLDISSDKYCERSWIYATFYHAVIYSLEGDARNAHINFETAIAKLEVYSDSFIQIELFEAYSQFLLKEKQYKKAITFAELMLETPSSHDDKKVLSGIYKVLVHCYRVLGDQNHELKYLYLENATLQQEMELTRVNEAKYAEKAVEYAKNEQQRNHVNNLKKHLESFSHLGQIIACSTEHSNALRIVASKLGEFIPFSMLALALYDEDKHVLDYRYIVDKGEVVEGPILDCYQNNKLGVYSAMSRETVLIDSGSVEELSEYINIDSVSSASLLVKSENLISSVLYVPMVLGGELLGVVTVQHERSYCYNDLHVHVIEQLANYIAISIKNQKQNQILEQQKEELNESHKRLEHLYRTDNLTGLLNRHALQEDTSDINQNLFSSILIDIDDYKPYNDHYGHVKGDHVLVQLAEVFKSECRYQGSVYRIGGDEFLILLRCQTTQCAFDIASRIKTKIQKLKIKHDQSTVSDRISCTFGIHTTEKGKNADLEQVLHSTDLALYQAKREGRNAIAVYNSESKKSFCI
ncbi:diguanylate cyclase domain-containing protein [Aliivibrio wodanis]|uniref:diguanylate cyclase domain-containing protein n=1 Tax=Aliivibrio wodanis TaxID=80852 RepID=UPI00406BFB65